MKIFYIWNLEANNFAFEGISFERLAGYREEIRKRRYNEHVLTFRAVAEDDLEMKPLLHEGGIVEAVDDVCNLLSLAQSRAIFCPRYEVDGRLAIKGIYGNVGKPDGYKLVLENEIQPYLTSAAATLRKQRWAEKVGFIPAVYFLLEAQSFDLVEAQFMMAWIALEVLTNAHAKKTGTSRILPPAKFDKVRKVLSDALRRAVQIGIVSDDQKATITSKLPELNRYAVRDTVKGLRDAHSWHFITDGRLDDYIEIRNHLMHSGTYGEVDKSLVGRRAHQLTATVQLALVDLLGFKPIAGEGHAHWIGRSY